MSLNKYQKGGCTSLNVDLYLKLIFGFLNPFMGYFKAHFRQRRMTLFIKLWFFFTCITQFGK